MSSKEQRREILGTATITYKYQVTIPKRVRDRAGLKEGNMLAFFEEGGKVFIAKSTDV